MLPEAKLAGTLERALRIFMKTILLYILPVPVMFIFSRKLKHSFTALLFLLLVSSQTALDVTQGTSAYFTTFNYGTNMSDYMKAISLVKNVKSDSLILAPVEFAVAADGHVKLLHVPGREWDSAVRIRQILEKQRPSLFIYGLPTNSTEQIKIKYTQPILINFLLSRYRKHALGDFTVWQRKNGGFQ